MIKSSPELSISSHRTTPAAISLEIGDVIKLAHQDQQDLERKLLKDSTKTKSAKSLFSAEAATKRISSILKRVEAKQKDLNGDLYQYNKKIEGEMKIGGTTDHLLLSSYGQIIKDFKIGQILDLAREGDKDALRAVLLLPALRMQPQFKKARELIETELQKQTLGDDYQVMQELKEKQKQADRLEIGLLQTLNDYQTEIKRISEKVVSEDEMPEVG